MKRTKVLRQLREQVDLKEWDLFVGGDLMQREGSLKSTKEVDDIFVISLFDIKFWRSWWVSDNIVVDNCVVVRYAADLLNCEGSGI